MKRVILVLVLAMSPYGGVFARPSVAVMEITSEPDSDFREQDLRIMESLRRELNAAGDLRVLTNEEMSAPFREPPDSAWGPLAKRAKERLRKGEAFYTRLKPKKAIKEFSEALRILRAIFPSLEGLSDLEQAHLMLGMTYQALGKNRQAGREYRMVLLLHPDRELDDTTVNPVVVERFNKVRERLLTSMKGSISLISKPAGARVYMNGRLVGYSPVTIPGVYPGEHYFSMELNGYKKWFGVLPLRPGGLEKREVYLQEGKRIPWVRLRSRMARAGIGKLRAGDAQKMAKALGADWLLLVSLAHLGGSTTMELGMFQSGSEEVFPLGIFSSDRDMSKASDRALRWVKGDRTPPEQKTFVRRRKPVDLPNQKDPLPPPPPPPGNGTVAWYQSWWFWTAVGAVVAGAAATTTVLLLDRDSGIQVDVYR